MRDRLDQKISENVLEAVKKKALKEAQFLTSLMPNKG